MTVRNLSMRMLVPLCLGAAALILPGQPVFAQATPVTASANAAAASRLGVDPQLIEDLVVANRILAREGILDAYGHVSVRHPTRPNHYLMGRSVAPEFLTADDIIEYDLDSNPVAPTGAKDLIERFIHGEIYKVRPEVQAVIHTHSAAVVPFSVSSVPLRPVFHMASFLAGGVPIWDPASSDDAEASAMLVRNSALGASLAAALGNKSAVLLRGHGEVLVGRDVRHAVRNTIFMDINARMQLAAIQLGGTVKYVSPDEARALTHSQGDPDRAWDYWKRRALSPR